jgi:hypothetical protein
MPCGVELKFSVLTVDPNRFFSPFSTSSFRSPPAKYFANDVIFIDQFLIGR